MSDLLRRLQGSILFIALSLLLTASLSGMALDIRAADDVIKGRVINTDGTGLANVQIKLVDSSNTMMDITQSDPDGFYSIDLSVLDDEELSKLRGFTIVANDKKGKVARKNLKGEDGNKGVTYQAIVLQ